MRKKCAASLHVFQQKKYVDKAKCKYEDAECASERGGEEHEENTNMVESNIEIKVVKEFPAGINIVRELTVTVMMIQMKRASVHVIRTGMYMKKEPIRLLKIKK